MPALANVYLANVPLENVHLANVPLENVLLANGHPALVSSRAHLIWQEQCTGCYLPFTKEVTPSLENSSWNLILEAIV